MLCETEGCGRKVTYYSKKRKRLVSAPDHTLCQRCYRAARNRHGHRQGPIEFPIVVNQESR
ncbi:hypothetical protein LCGC14_0827830 [marine sediment metagenome]|uniref:Uncharacterized protein n=1 Tax=marine sediment metagenome TaxID=412755 RepID=A0A0F9SP76_9ZZZZ